MGLASLQPLHMGTLLWWVWFERFLLTLLQGSTKLLHTWQTTFWYWYSISRRVFVKKFPFLAHTNTWKEVEHALAFSKFWWWNPSGINTKMYQILWCLRWTINAKNSYKSIFIGLIFSKKWKKRLWRTTFAPEEPLKISIVFWALCKR